VEKIITQQPERPSRSLEQSRRLLFGLFLVGYGIYRLIDLLGNLPNLRTERDPMIVLFGGILPALAVMAFLGIGIYMLRQSHYGTTSPRREE
jgi:hypothetical protein